MSPPPTGFQPPKLLPTYSQEFRNHEQARLQQLGLPHQSQGKQSIVKQPRTKAVNQLTVQAARPTANFQTTKKPGSGTFDPDKNFKAFEKILQPGKKGTHKDYDFSQYFTKKAGAPTQAPVQRRQDISVKRQQSVAVATTKKPLVFHQPAKPTAQRTNQATARPFVANQPTKVTTRRTTRAPVTPRAQQFAQRQQQPVAQRQQQPQAFRQNQQQAVQQTVKPNRHQPQQQQAIKQIQQQAYKQNQLNNQASRPTVKPVVSTSPPRVVSKQIAIQRPSAQSPGRGLQPPLNAIKTSAAATAKTQSGNYEWKVPDRGIQPPKFINDSDAQSSKRSVAEEGNFDNSLASGEKRRLGSGNSVKVEYKDLQKLFAIPQVELPLELKGREGYEKADAVNSFQVKIPYKTGKQERYYYLEHGHCNPECHPYFFKPGRCEPCIKL